MQEVNEILEYATCKSNIFFGDKSFLSVSKSIFVQFFPFLVLWFDIESLKICKDEHYEMPKFDFAKIFICLFSKVNFNHFKICIVLTILTKN